MATLSPHWARLASDHAMTSPSSLFLRVNVTHGHPGPSSHSHFWLMKPQIINTGAAVAVILAFLSFSCALLTLARSALKNSPSNFLTPFLTFQGTTCLFYVPSSLDALIFTFSLSLSHVTLSLPVFSSLFSPSAPLCPCFFVTSATDGDAVASESCFFSPCKSSLTIQIVSQIRKPFQRAKVKVEACHAMHVSCFLLILNKPFWFLTHTLAVSLRLFSTTNVTVQRCLNSSSSSSFTPKLYTSRTAKWSWSFIHTLLFWGKKCSSFASLSPLLHQKWINLQLLKLKLNYWLVPGHKVSLHALPQVTGRKMSEKIIQLADSKSNPTHLSLPLLSLASSILDAFNWYKGKYIFKPIFISAKAQC